MALELSWQAVTTLGATGAAVAAMASGRVAPDVALLGAVALVWLSGAVDTAVALGGFANPALAAIAALFVVAAAVQDTGVLRQALEPLLGRAAGVRGLLLRLLPVVAALSALLNNTPLVAMLLPELRDRARRIGASPSKVLIPLSYAAIVGGACTLVGTSTNLVVAGLMVDAGMPAPGIFDVTPLALPIAGVGVALAALGLPSLLPDRREAADPFADPEQYLAEVIVQPGGPLVGRSLAEVTTAEGRALNPVEIQRADGSLLRAPDVTEPLVGGDRLVLAADQAGALALHAIDGLEPGDGQGVHREDSVMRGPHAPELVEVVIGLGCPVIGDTVGDGSFRRRYGAAILAVARNGSRVGRERGVRGWTLRQGDVLLVEARPGFVERHRDSRHFYLLAPKRLPAQVRPRTPVVLGLVVAMLAAAGTGALDLAQAALGAAVLCLAIGGVRPARARRSLDLSVLLAIGAALGLGHALDTTGAAAALAELVVGAAGTEPRVVLAALVLATLVITELVTNNAAAALMIPVAIAASARLGQADATAFVMAVMVAASSSFLTPVGYQTNLMVYGPGQYRYGDYLRAGLPMTLVVLLGTVLLAPLLYGGPHG